MTVSIEDIADADLPDDATLWEKRMQALTMRNAGATWARIAETYKITQDRAQRWVRAATKEIVKLPIDQMVDRQRAILLDITRRNYPVAMGDSDNAREAQGVIIRCLEHEAKLYGLYAPARVAVGLSETEFGQNAAELLKLVGTAPLAELAGLPTGATALETVQIRQAEPVDAEVIEEPWSNV